MTHAEYIEFDPATHTYRVGGKIWPGVNDLLKEAGLIDTRWYTPEAAERGRVAAACIALDLRGELDEATVDPVVAPYLAAARKFVREHGLRAKLVEHRVASMTYEFCGTLDAFGRINRSAYSRHDNALIDWKCGVYQPWHLIQLAMYATALRTTVATYSRLVVELRDDGDYKLHPDSRPWESAKVAAAVAELSLYRRNKLGHSARFDD